MTTQGTAWAGRWYALQTFGRMVRHLTNWPEAWSRYRARLPLEQLRFRGGAVVTGTERDDLWQTFLELWVLRTYDAHYAVRTGDLVLDLGANFGGLALSALERGERPDVLCCEPSPLTAANLRRNLSRSGLDRVRVLEVAAGRQRGEAAFFFGEKSVMDGLIPAGADQTGATRVPVWPLVELVAEARRAFPGERPVALLKMDIEGGEAETLEGAGSEGLRDIERVALEFHDPLVPGSRARCEAVLHAAGFQLSGPPPGVRQGVLFARRPGLPY
jgi:FkbM family methyltransferase